MMGQVGAFLVALQLFLAITSTANSEQLAVASLFAYDVCKRYINPEAKGKTMIIVSQVMVCVWGVISGVIAIILFKLGIGLGWVYGAMGNSIGSAVFPITFALMLVPLLEGISQDEYQQRKDALIQVRTGASPYVYLSIYLSLQPWPSPRAVAISSALNSCSLGVAGG
jgi:Na+/proline symporter